MKKNNNVKAPQKGYVDQVKKISKKEYLHLIKLALKEDRGQYDVTSRSIFKKTDKAVAILICKSQGVLCGIDIFKDVFKTVDESLIISTKYKDGANLKKGDIIVEIHGSTLKILQAERVALNFISMLSGISSKVNNLAKLLDKHNITILDTRKTIPGYRLISKYAVYTGGGTNHRLNLEDMGLIKDNHIAAGDGVQNSIKLFRKKNPGLKCEVEVENIRQLNEALEEKPDMLLLDNMSPALLKECTNLVKKFNRQYGTNITCEASGGYNSDNIKSILKSGVDYISMGALTNTIDPVDFSLEIKLKG